MSAEQKIIEALLETNKELKAQLGLIQERNIDLLNSNRVFEYSGELDRLFEAIEKTPQQCLADVRADAIIKAIDELKPSQHSDSHMLVACSHFMVYAQQLRDNAK